MMGNDEGSPAVMPAQAGIQDRGRGVKARLARAGNARATGHHEATRPAELDSRLRGNDGWICLCHRRPGLRGAPRRSFRATRGPCLLRVFVARKERSGSVIMGVTADRPLVDIAVMPAQAGIQDRDRGVKAALMRAGNARASGHHGATRPIGLDSRLRGNDGWMCLCHRLPGFRSAPRRFFRATRKPSS